MKKLFFGLLVLVFIATNSSVVLAQTTQTTQTRTVTAPAPTPTRTVDVPGTVGLFFRGVGQQLQLIFTFDSVKDASLRLQFAEDNLNLVNLLVKQAPTNQRAIDQAQKLFDRANELVRNVNENQTDWSTANPEKLNGFIDSVQAYYAHASELISTIIAESGDNAGDLLATAKELGTQQNELVNYIQKQFAEPTQDQSAPRRLVTVPKKDRDSDGLDDDQEKDLGLSTEDYDTDGDGLSDRAEIERFGSDPSKADTDGDGFRDGVEVLKGYNPVGSGVFTSSSAEKGKFVFIEQAKLRPNLDPKTVEYLDKALNNYRVTK